MDRTKFPGYFWYDISREHIDQYARKYLFRGGGGGGGHLVQIRFCFVLLLSLGPKDLSATEVILLLLTKWMYGKNNNTYITMIVS